MDDGLIYCYGMHSKALELAERPNGNGNTGIEMMVSSKKRIEMGRPKKDVSAYGRPVFISNAAYISY